MIENQYKSVKKSERHQYIPSTLSLTSRRRNHVLTQKTITGKILKKFQRAKFKLKSVLYWTNIIKQIRKFGTGSSLLDGKGYYKENLALIMKTKSINSSSKANYLLRARRKAVILPHFLFAKLWNFVLSISLLYTCTVMPWTLAFVDSETMPPWLYLNPIIDIIFFFDIIVTANLAYYDKNNQLIYSRKEIIKNYAKTMLIFDILAVMPFTYISESSPKINSYFKILRLARLVRIFKAMKLRKIIETLTNGKEIAYLAINRFILCFFFILFLIHFTSCLWNFLPKIDSSSPDVWTLRNNQSDQSSFDLYITGIYFAVTTIFTVGFGDYSGETISEMILCIILELFGIGIYSFVFGVTTTFLTSIDHKQALLKTKMNMVSLFCKDIALPKYIKKKAQKELKKFNENIILNNEERKEIMRILPKSMRYKIASAMYSGRVQSIFFFQRHEKFFFSTFVPRLTFSCYHKNEVIFSQGDYPESMYFLMTGRVSFVFDKSNLVFKDMICGSYFGEIGLLEKKPREFGAVTCCFSEILVMSWEVVKELFEQFPSVYREIENIGIKKSECIIKDKLDIIDLLEIVEVKKDKAYDQIAGYRDVLLSTNPIVFPYDWVDYKNNLELQNKILIHELSLILKRLTIFGEKLGDIFDLS